MTELPDHQSPRIVHTDGSVVYANEAFRSVLGGRSRESIVGSDPTSFVAKAYRESLQTQFETLESADAPALGLTAELDGGQGSDRDVTIVSSPTEWDGERAIQSTFIDVTDELSAGPIFTRAMNAAPVGITIAEATVEDVPLIFASEGFTEMTGYDRSEAIGRNCRFLQGEGTRQEPVDQIRAAIDAEEPVTVVLRNYRKDGPMFWNRVTITPISNADGETTHFLGYQEDVTETKLHEQEKTLFERHAEAAQHAMFITTRDGVIEYVNPAFEQMTGYTAAEAIGCTPRILKSSQQDPAFYDELWETITAGDIWERELTNQTKSGELYRVRQTIVPIVNDYDEITHFAAIEHDITETEFTEQIVDVMNRVLRHDLRTSVTIIDGYAELLADRLDDPELRDAAMAISERATALERTSEKTRAIRNLFQNRNEHQPATVETIASYVAICRQKHGGATIDCAIDVDAGVAVKNGQLVQVAIEEAIENAVIHSDRERPCVDVRLTRLDTELVIEIADDGPGIPDSEWNVITTGEETPLIHGSGIGLWLIYWSITALGGTVDYTPTDPRGSVLTYRVPIVTDPR